MDELLKWKIGTRIMLDTKVDDETELRCGLVPVFKGPAGQREGRLAVRIEKYIPPEKGEDD